MSEFSHEPAAANLVVEYRSPAVDRLMATIKAGFLMLFYTGAAALAGMFLLVAMWPAAPPPMWVFVILGGAVLATPIGVLWLFNRHEPKRIVLRDDAVWLGGILGGRTIAYDVIDLLKIENSPSASIDDVKITIRYGWRQLFIRLGAQGGNECFDALCALCDGAASIAMDESFSPPPNPARRDRGRRQLMREFSKRGRDSLAGASLFAALSIAALVATVIPTNAVVTIASQVLMIAAAAGAGGAIWRYLKMRRIVREIAALRDEDEGETSSLHEG